MDLHLFYAKVALNTTPTTSIAAPIVDNKKNIVSYNTSIVNPKRGRIKYYIKYSITSRL